MLIVSSKVKSRVIYPGGPGHQWAKARYIDPAPLGNRLIRDEQTGLNQLTPVTLPPGRLRLAT
jgi:hypothetical protein